MTTEVYDLFFFSSRRRHTRYWRDWSSDVCSSDLDMTYLGLERLRQEVAEDEGIERDVVVGEFGYDTTPGAWYHVPEPRRAEYLAAALEQATEWNWLVAFTPYSYAAGPEDGFSIRGTPS